jgi:uncharacterized protein (DUF608 family)
MGRAFNSPYEGKYNRYVAFPLGGIGAGMLCLEGTGALSHVSLWNKPDVNYEPAVFAALCVKGTAGNRAVVLEGPVPTHKIFRVPGGGNGLGGKTYGLPRFENCSFSARFPFGTVSLSDESFPLTAELTGWSPFLPGRADDSSLPVAALEYAICNPTAQAVEAVFSFHVPARMAGPQESPGDNVITHVPGGFVVEHKPADGDDAAHGWLGVTADRPEAEIYSQWFRGGWFDPLTILWNRIERGETAGAEPYREGGNSPGSSLFVPLAIAPGGTQTVKVLISWYAPNSGLNTVKPDEEIPCDCACGCGCDSEEGKYYKPWYAVKFPDIGGVMRYWSGEYGALREASKTFTDCFYASTLPPEVVEAAAANLAILKSPTVLREQGGRLWCWEGCCDSVGCCAGSCTHVWNYAQALPHLFPDLERSLRDVEFNYSQDESGHQNFRAALPFRDYVHKFHAAADGQLGGIMKVWREWRVCGDEKWLRQLWPSIKKSLEYCIETWDPEGRGVLTEPHHNTYDIEFWGPDGMCSSFYLGALLAASAMAEALEEDGSRWAELAAKGRKYLEEKLFDGEYFIQEVRRTRSKDSGTSGISNGDEQASPEARALFAAEGPKYQYGTGCLSDGVLGAWIACVCGVEADLLDPDKVKSHLASVYKYNLKKDLSRHANPQRPGYALGKEGGLLLCTWPKGGKPSLPFVYSDEVWTGIEYQAASHMMLCGLVEEGLEVVRACRGRYDGSVRNPFDEYECGHWYARAMASWALLQSLSGAFYDAVERRMTLKPRVKGDFQCFIATASGYGLVGVRGGKPFLCVKKGSIPVKEWAYTPKE